MTTDIRDDEADEAAMALGHLGGALGLPLIFSGEFLSPDIVRATVASRTVLDGDVLAVASVVDKGV